MSKMILNSPHIINEFLVSLADACNYFPIKCSRQTLERWMRLGCRGIILESVTIGSRRFTSKEAITRFLSAQAGAQVPVHTPCANRPHIGGRMSKKEIAEKSREHGLPE